jgi:hypothetical protein
MYIYNYITIIAFFTIYYEVILKTEITKKNLRYEKIM